MQVIFSCFKNEQLTSNNDSDNVSQKCLISIYNNSFFIANHSN